MAQITYTQDPAVAVAGMNAEPLAPQRTISRIAFEDIGFGLGVQTAEAAGSDPLKNVEVCTAAAKFIGFALMSDNVEMTEGAAVTLAEAKADATKAYGEVAVVAEYKKFKQMPVMQSGSLYVLSGEDLSALTYGAELMCDASGKVVTFDDTATSAYRVFLEDAAGPSAADELVKVRVSGPQGAAQA